MSRNGISAGLAGLAVAVGVLVLPGRAAGAPVPPESERRGESIFSLIRKGGPVMIPIGIGSVLALALAIERFISLRREKVIPPGFIDELKSLWGKEHTARTAAEYCERVGGPVGSIFRAGILRLDKGEAAVEKAIEDTGFREAEKLKRSLRGLSIIATVSPLLGLLGTVYGMIIAFQTASSVGMGKADVLARGIYEALVTTAAGLTIAIPVLLTYQYLNTKVDGIVDELDELGMEFMAFCVGGDSGPET